MLSISMFYYKSMAQGCSDAGFCTMGAMKPDQPFSRKIKIRLRSIELNFYRGKTTLDPVVYVATAEFNFSLNQRNSFQIKAPFQWVEEGIAYTGGIGDLSLSYTHTLFHSDKYDINGTIGTKIASNNADLKYEGHPLPMYYQTSLGTYDMIAGISYLSRGWLLATGIQHPFNRNGNEFLWGAWASTPDSAEVRQYPPANGLKRGTDVMMRVEKDFRFSRIDLSLGLLPIYRINKDEIIKNGEKIKLDGSTGLALTALATLGYSFNVRSGIKLLYGKKITNRTMEPDGLTRPYVTTISYYYRF